VPRNRSTYSIAFIGAVVLGVSSAALALSVFAALIGHRGLLVAPGGFLADIYGGAAYLVPAYLFVAAVVLADPAYRPARLFVLACSIVPFLTVAFGAAVIIRPEEFFDRFSIPDFLSPTGVAAIVAAATAVEGFAIAVSAMLLFGEAKRPAPKTAAREGGGIRPRFLPVPIADEREAAEEPETAPEEPPASVPAPRKLLELPAMRELGSLEAERELTAKRAAASEPEAEPGEEPEAEPEPAEAIPELESVDPAVFYEDIAEEAGEDASPAAPETGGAAAGSETPSEPETAEAEA
jgi:hypothetical protein